VLPRQIHSNVYSVGVIDWDLPRFDNLVPLPEGTSYNCYLIKDEESTILIDTVDQDRVEELLENLKAAEVDTIDVIVCNHAEQDHSGAIPSLMTIYPQAKVVTSKKGKSMLEEMYSLDEDRVIVVNDGEELTFESVHLKFIYTPWVHWPETMVTYYRGGHLLFSCDFLGAHIATSELYASAVENIIDPAKRYYAEIMMPYRNFIVKHLEKIAPLSISKIAPSHGPVYDQPKMILDLYKQWTSEDCDGTVVITYISMHGTIEKLAHQLTNLLIDRNIRVKLMNLVEPDIGAIAMALVNAEALVMAGSTVLNGPHPNAASAAFLINMLKPKLKYAAIVTAFGWGGKMAEKLHEMLGDLKATFLPDVKIKNKPDDGDYGELVQLADLLAEKIRKRANTRKISK
jgi:flavorubredoxin